MVVDKKQIETWFTNWNSTEMQQKKACLFHGKAGTGKTSTAYSMAEKFGYTIIEINSSDERSKEALTKILKSIRSSSITPILYLFDEADGLQVGQRSNTFDILKEIINESIHPIILTANELYKIPLKIRELCFAVEFRVRLSEVLSVIKKENGNATDALFQNAVPDFRQAKLMKYNTEGYKRKLTTNEQLVDGLRTGKLDESDLTSEQLLVLLDNSKQFYGIDLIKLVQGLSLADRGIHNALHDIKNIKTTKLERSYFFEKLKKIRTGQDGSTDYEDDFDG